MPDTHIGVARSRVDGPKKVSGTATYAGEFGAEGLLHGCVLNSTIAQGRITRIDASAAEAMPGVVRVITHENRPRTAWRGSAYHDDVAPPGTPFRALYDDHVAYSGQPVALVVAESFEIARDAATLVRIEYQEGPHSTDLALLRDSAKPPSKQRSGIPPPPKPRGHPAQALDGIPVLIDREYHMAAEHHNPMEPHASTVIVQADGSLLVHDKVQGVQNSLKYLQAVFGRKDIRVVTPFVGGAFGSGLRPQYQLFLAVLAATMLNRSVRVVLTRDQMFTFTHRPETYQRVQLGATRDGTFQVLRHEAVAETSRFEEYQEVVVSWSGLLYNIEHADFVYKLAPMDVYTPGDMRAPGAPTGTFAIESAVDELAATIGIDPVSLRLKNYSEKDGNEGKPWASKELRAAIQRGADRFGWEARNPAPRSMREGQELIGWGMAIGAWDAQMMETEARAVLHADGTLEVTSATADIGTGTYTILTQIAAETAGVPMEHVDVKIGDSDFPNSPIEGGSWTAASAGMAVQTACFAVREKLFAMARGVPDSPLANVAIDRVVFEDRHVVFEADPSRRVAYVDAMRVAGVTEVRGDGKGEPNAEVKKTCSNYTHGACFVEVRVDEELGVIRVARVVQAIAAGRIINPKTARSQIIGGTVFGMGMALYEESMLDHQIGRYMNHNLAEYHVATSADMPQIDVIFVDESDPSNTMGVKGCGEIAGIASPAAIANAVWHATGKRMRDLPITIDKLLAAESAP